jgi:inner membrane protein
MSASPSFFEKLSQWFRNSISFKIFSIAFLIIVLLIPASMVESLIRERQFRQEEAVNEISSKWGGDQLIVGPIMSIPFYEEVLDPGTNTMKKFKQYAYFLPENLHIEGELFPERRHRGIYEAVLYKSLLQIEGKFNQPDFEVWKVDQKNILWDEAELLIGISDLRGVNEEVNLLLNGKEERSMSSGLSDRKVISSGIACRLNMPHLDSLEEGLSFQTSLSLNGSRQFQLTPVGALTELHLRSEWSSPKFSGQFLPDQHELSEAGFDANWKVLQLNRNFPQQWYKAQNLSGAEMGVELMIGVDQYQKNERSAKYAILIIGLSFLIFFFIEVLNRKRIHPIQYLLVGLALLLFYTLLLAISEQAGFAIAYLISSLAVIGLISFYVSAFFKSTRFTALLSGTLSILYGFVFVILQLQDYALLVGSIGLFLVLGTVMYATRKIDWYAVNQDD